MVIHLVIGGEILRNNCYNWAAACDFQQGGILTWIDSDELVQPPVNLRNSKCCSVSSLTVVEYSLAMALIRLHVWAFAGRTHHIVGNLSGLKLLLSLCLLVSSADDLGISLDPDQTGQYIRLKQSGSKLFDTAFFLKLNIENNQQITKNMQNYPACRVNKENKQCLQFMLSNLRYFYFYCSWQKSCSSNLRSQNCRISNRRPWSDCYQEQSVESSQIRAFTVSASDSKLTV